MNQEIQVGLGLNTSQFQEGLKGASRNVSSFADKIKAPFAAIAGLGGALAGVGLVSQIQSISDYAEKVRNLGEALNANTTDLQKWFNAISYSGVGSETATKALTKFTMNLNSAAEGAGKEAEAFANLGVNIKDTEGNIRPTMEILGDVSDIFATMPDKSERSRVAVELFGKQGLKMVAALSVGREEMERLGNIKAVISPEALETLDKMGDDLKEIFDSVKGGGAKAIVALSPLVEFWKESFNGFKAGAQLYVDYVATIFDAIATKVTTGEGTLRTALSAIGDLFTSGGDGMTTDKKQAEAKTDKLKTIRSMVAASKEQAEFEKQGLKHQIESASVGEKVKIIAEQVAAAEEKAAEAEKHKDDSAEAGRKHKALETDLAAKVFDLDKAIAAQQDDATKKRIAAYTHEEDALNRINKLKELGADLERTLADIRERGTKSTVEQLANSQLLNTDSPALRKAKQDAFKVKQLEDAQKAAQKRFDPKEAARLQGEAEKARAKLDPAFFQQDQIRPNATIENRLAEQQRELEIERHMREVEKQAAEKAKQAALKAERDKNGAELGRGWFVTDEEKRAKLAAAVQKAADEKKKVAKDVAVALAMTEDEINSGILNPTGRAAGILNAAPVVAKKPEIAKPTAEPMTVEEEFAAKRDQKAAMIRGQIILDNQKRQKDLQEERQLNGKEFGPGWFITDAEAEKKRRRPVATESPPDLSDTSAPVVHPDFSGIDFNPSDLTAAIEGMADFDSEGIIEEMTGLRADIKAGIRVRLANTA